MFTRDQLDVVLIISKCKNQLRKVAGSGGKKNASLGSGEKKNAQPPHSDGQKSHFGFKKQKKGFFLDLT